MKVKIFIHMISLRIAEGSFQLVLLFALCSHEDRGTAGGESGKLSRQPGLCTTSKQYDTISLHSYTLSGKH